MATGRSSRITSPGQPGAGGMDLGKCPVVRWRDIGQEGVMAFMAPILAQNRPFLLTGYWSHQVLNKDATQRWRSFQGIKSVLVAHGLEELRVDVACTKKGQAFRGDQASRQHVSLRLIDLVDLAEAIEEGRPHWASAEEVGLDYYLCQCPVVSREEGKPEVLSALAGEFRTPSCVVEEDLLQINLWLGAMETTTNMHYDANHNLLYVLKGRKKVVLLPPNMTAKVHAMPVFSESANHSGLEHAGAVELVGMEEAMKKGAVYAEVGEGEGIFIPEGWWHQITSLTGTVAVNVWFKGVRPALCEGPSRHMREYYLRCLVDSLLSERLRGAAEVNSRTNDGSSDYVGAVNIDGKVVGLKRQRVATPPSPPPMEQSPLTAPSSSVEQRNLYLRTIGAPRMKEELPSIALTRPADWARLVTGLDPLTAHVLTTQWEEAGGAASMPEFYEAIFGNAQGAGGTVGDSSASDAVSQALGAGVGVDSVPGDGSDEVGGDATVSLSMDASFEGGLGHVPTVEQPGAGVGIMGGVVGGRPEEYSGVALQARLVRLREAFAQQECRELLHAAVGL